MSTHRVCWGCGLVLAVLSPAASGQTASGLPQSTVGWPAAVPAVTDLDVYAVLARTLDDVRFTDCPLDRVLAELCSRIGLNVLIRREELREAGVDPETRVTLILRNVPVSTALGTLFASLDDASKQSVGYYVDEGVLVCGVLRPEHWGVPRRYDVGDLLRTPEPSQSVTKSLQVHLERVIRQAIHPDSWEYGDSCGPGRMAWHSDALIVSNNIFVHAETESLLTLLRQVEPCGQEWVHPVLRASARDDARVNAALQRVFPLIRFQDATLAEVAEHLRHVLGINIHVCELQLEADGFDKLMKRSVELRNVTAERGLRAYLDQLTSEWFPAFETRGGVLLISTRASLATELFTRVYEVSDLLRANPRLPDIVLRMVDPDSWEEGGGAGRGVLELYRGRMVIRNTMRAHRETEKLLAQMRQLPAGPK